MSDGAGPASFGRVEEDGTLRSFGDVYGHNAKLIELLNAP